MRLFVKLFRISGTSHSKGCVALERFRFHQRKTWAALVILAALSTTAVGERQLHAQPAPVSINIGIAVGPIADISFPEGQSFRLHVPEQESADGAHIESVRIPFTVLGNSKASIFASPDDFVRIAEGTYRGQARGTNGAKGEDLGYDVVVQFPVPTRHYAGLPQQVSYSPSSSRFGIANLPRTHRGATPAMTADVAAHRSVAHGTIHIVARQDWTTSGRNATPGEYAGSIQVMIVAE